MGRGVGSGKRKFDIVSEMRSGTATKCCGFIVILTTRMRQSRKEVNKQRRVRTLCKIFNLSGLTSQLVFVLMRSNNDYEETRELPYFGTRSCFSLGCGGRGNLVHLCSLDPVSTVVGLPRFLKTWRLAITVFKSSEKLHTS